jgi:phospholipase/carboxylesterase
LTTDPHGDIAVLLAGAPLEGAAAVMIMLHGRGASAEDILSLAPVLNRPALACLAPNAAGQVWYPQRFLAPRLNNEPFLSSALAAVGRLVALVVEAGVAPEKIVLLGFSQGACLALDFAARNPRRYGGLVALSGGLIGDAIAAADYPGSLDGTPAFLGCSDVDPHIPLVRVRESAAVLRAMGAVVTERIYPNAGHTVLPDEVTAVQAMVDAL